MARHHPGRTTTTFAVLAPGADPADRLAALHRPAHARGPQLHHHARRHPAGRHGALPVREPRAVRPPRARPSSSTRATASPGRPTRSRPARPRARHHVPRTAATRTCSRTAPPTWVRSLARVAGFATVSLQMRGTGCSGGAFDLFGYPSDYDAYDAIEIVAHQDWVANHKVGHGRHQLLGSVGAPLGRDRPAGPGRHRPDEPDRRPVLDRLPRRHLQRRLRRRMDRPSASTTPRPAATLVGGSAGAAGRHPGVRRGPALDLLRDRRRAGRVAAARPRPAWPTRPCTASPRACRRWWGPRMVAPGTGPGRDPSLFDRRSMTQWATRITVPVFVSGALQDEQTGPQWPALLSALPARRRRSSPTW